MVVVDGVVLGGIVVPDGDGPGGPAQAAAELGQGRLLEEQLEDWPAVLLVHPVETHGVGRVDVERAGSGHRVGEDGGVKTLLVRLRPAQISGIKL